MPINWKSFANNSYLNPIWSDNLKGHPRKRVGLAITTAVTGIFMAWVPQIAAVTTYFILKWRKKEASDDPTTAKVDQVRQGSLSDSTAGTTAVTNMPAQSIKSDD